MAPDRTRTVRQARSSWDLSSGAPSPRPFPTGRWRQSSRRRGGGVLAVGFEADGDAGDVANHVEQVVHAEVAALELECGVEACRVAAAAGAGTFAKHANVERHRFGDAMHGEIAIHLI